MSNVTVSILMPDLAAALVRKLSDMDSRHDTSLVILTSPPMATLTGRQYDLLVRMVANGTTCTFIEVPSLSVGRDWLDGYSQVLEVSLRIGISDVQPDLHKAPIVGYLTDRTERMIARTRGTGTDFERDRIGHCIAMAQEPSGVSSGASRRGWDSRFSASWPECSKKVVV